MRPFYRYHAFISYAHKDLKEVLELTQQCQKFCLRLWVDLDTGENDTIERDNNDPRGMLIKGDEQKIEEVLQNEITSSIITIVITSPNTLSSVWVRKEIQISAETKTPLFFWHLSEDEPSETVSIRRKGFSFENKYLPADEIIELENLFGFFKEEKLPTISSRSFMKELSSKRSFLNIVGQQIRSFREIKDVLSEINTLIELSELILHYDHEVNSQNLMKFWPEYAALTKKALDLKETILTKYGRRIEAGRVPIADYFNLKRPFVKSRIIHYERILADEEFREKEFSKLKSK